MRLNGDSSWLIQLNNTRLILDPWLVGEQVDVASWFNRQSHQDKCLTIRDLPPIDAILISHPFTDHCHEATLKQFSADTPIFASPMAFKIIQKWRYFTHLQVLNPSAKVLKPLLIKDIEIHFFAANHWLDLTHQALFLRAKASQKTVFYAPHGYWVKDLKNNQLLDNQAIDLVLCTFSWYKLPWYLGGVVNFGAHNTLQLLKQLQAKFALATHDEHKIARGLVARLAQTEYTNNLDKLLADNQLLTQIPKLEIGQVIEL